MDLSKILVISGKPDLHELISQTKSGAIVESLADHKRQPIFKTERISSLNEISIFTNEGDVPLREVLQAIYRHEEEKNISFDIKNTPNKTLFDYFAVILPNYDTDRVHASDIKKVLLWYNLLNTAGRIDLINPDENAENATTDENSETTDND